MIYSKAKTSSTRPATAATLFSCVLVKSFALFYQILLETVYTPSAINCNILSIFDSPLA
jgi:hypothetical protein